LAPAVVSVSTRSDARTGATQFAVDRTRPSLTLPRSAASSLEKEPQNKQQAARCEKAPGAPSLQTPPAHQLQATSSPGPDAPLLPRPGFRSPPSRPAVQNPCCASREKAQETTTAKQRFRPSCTQRTALRPARASIHPKA